MRKGYGRIADMEYEGNGNRFTEFELSGLDAGKLEVMRKSERREVLRAAGLNPDEYDF